jgi:hypothetical protein
MPNDSLEVDQAKGHQDPLSSGWYFGRWFREDGTPLPPSRMVLQGRNSPEGKSRTKMRSTKQIEEANVIQQREALQDEIKDLDLQLEQLQERRTALSQAMSMAAKEEQGKRGRPPDELEMFDTPEVRNLNMLQWRPFGPGKKGEWTFATERNGRLVKQLEQSPLFISALKAHQRVDRGGYHYKISGNGRFLHRFPADNSQ